MFFSKKKKEEHASFAWLNADMHSHLIPGIDDGSPDIATSISYIKGLAALGYKKLVTTPHILWDVYPNTTEIINAGIERLRAAVHQEAIDIEVRAAAEYFIDDHFQSLLQT